MNTNRKGLSVVLYENKTIAQLYSTLIFVFDGNTVTLRREHWKTRHTKNCINDLFDAIGWKARVIQRDFEWYVQDESKNLIPFEDGMKLHYKDVVRLGV